MLEKLKFPSGFLWGAATSAYQVEGGITNNWSEWEKANAERLAVDAGKKWMPWQQEKFPEMFDRKNYICGQACEHYDRYEFDFDIAKSLGHTAHRFSIEWSRIEPEEGKFDEREIEHYRKVIIALKTRGMEPFVTLWHWTNPIWLEKKMGCVSGDFPFYFSRYCEYVAKKLGGEVKFWITLNEPTSVIASAYVTGMWPPQKRSLLAGLRLYKIFAKAHIEAYRHIHEVDPEAKVGFANLLHSYDPYQRDSFWDNLMIRFAKYLTNRKMLNLTRGYNDFLTVQFYFHNRFKFPKKIHLGDKPVSDMNWEIFPYGIYRIIKKLKEYNLPIYVTENGLADAKDEKRKEFIEQHLIWIHRAIQEGADVRGYFYWSFLDNFEWDKGFWPRFGLVEIDYRTQERRIRPSALYYKKVIETNGGCIGSI
jgi:beta-glucosidase